MTEEAQQRAGQLVLYIALFLFAAFLAVSFPSEVKWFYRMPVHKQPGLWALISVSGMLITGAAMAWQAWRQTRDTGMAPELAFWGRSVEYLAWFMAYVFAVPVLGYLPASILFCIALTLRLGYRGRGAILAATALAIATVVIFRAFLQVQVPAGQLYELLPAPLGPFMMTYL